MKIFFTTLAFISSTLFLHSSEEVHQVVILGGGIGGLTSAIYAGRAGMAPLLVEGPSPGGAITQSHKVQNWPGEVEISGWELMERVHKQAETCGVRFLEEEVVAVDFTQKPFVIMTQDSVDPSKTRKIRAKSCVIALGSSPKFLNTSGEESYWLNGVYNCAVCDGALYKDKVVAVVGGGDGAIVEAHYLSKIAKKVYIIVRGNGFKTVEDTRKKEVLAKANVEVKYATTIEEIKGDGDGVTHLFLKQEQLTELLPVDALFLAIGSKPNTDLFKGQLELDKLGYIVSKKEVATSVPGVFAIGDIADPIYRQAISAAADGMKASFQVEKFLATQSSSHVEQSVLAHLSNKTNLAPSVQDISSEQELDQLLRDTSTSLFVDFYASWCKPCRQIAPQFIEASEELGGKIRFAKVNIEHLPNLSHRFNVKSLPTLLVFQKGELIGRKSGKEPVLRLLNASRIQLKNSSVADVDLFLRKQTKKSAKG